MMQPRGPLRHDGDAGEANVLVHQGRFAVQVLFAQYEDVDMGQDLGRLLPRAHADATGLIPLAQPALGGHADQGVGKKGRKPRIDLTIQWAQMDDRRRAPGRRYILGL